jgi:FAD/FMN-containing dehydrogenase
MNPALRPVLPPTVNDLDPTFWLGCSLLLVAVSLTAVLMAALPVIQELARAARSAEKFFDTLNRELPPTMAAIRLTGAEIGDLKKDVDRGVQSAVNVVEKVDRGLVVTQQQVGQAQIAVQGFWVGTRAAWQTFRAYNHAPAPTIQTDDTRPEQDPVS